jgi:hypothetical protein
MPHHASYLDLTKSPLGDLTRDTSRGVVREDGAA